MEGLLTLLFYAALFYLMMRFGCGAHMVHGHGHGRQDHGEKVEAATHEHEKDSGGTR